MSWSRWLRDEVRKFLTACTGADWPGRRDQATRLLERLDEEPSAPGARPAPAAEGAPTGHVDKSALPFAVRTRPSQRERKAERNDRMRTLRILVLRRARGRCEFRCPERDEPVDAHHVLGGADRRELESEYTLAAVCDECHKKCNASPAWAREQGLAWARRMAAAAKGHGHYLAWEQFTATAEQLEARIALAAAQAQPVSPTTTRSE